MKSYIYDYKKGLEYEIRNLNNSLVSVWNKKLILDFYNYNYSRDISIPRMIRQIGCLKMTALFLKKTFGDASVQDFQRFIAHLKQLNRAQETIYTYQSTLKVFYKWLNEGKGYPDCVAWFSGSGRKSVKLPESLLIVSDFN